MHPLDRARERYDLDLTRADLQEVERRIANGESVLLGEDSRNSQANHLIEIMGRVCRIGVCTISGAVKTFLPREKSFNQRGKANGGVPRQVKNRRRDPWYGKARRRKKKGV